MNACPPHLAPFLASAIEAVRADERLLGLAAGGSALTGQMDEFSDLDLVIGVEPATFPEVLDERQTIAQGLGALLGAFTGEHVGEPRLLVCLYDSPLAHVDLKFVSLDDVHDRVEDPIVLWDRDGRFGQALGRGDTAYPRPDLQWIEDRFWIWIHYGAGRIGRGELLEAMDMLAFLRGRVLGPMALMAAGERPSGLRRIETRAPDHARALQGTLGGPDPLACASALRAAADMYHHLRERLGGDSLSRRTAAERASLDYLAGVTARARTP